MTAKELFEKYPKSGEVIVKYYTDVFMNSLDTEDITEEFKELAKTQMVDPEYIQSFIDSNPRGTFDVFDNNGIYITTPVSPADGHFRWEIQTDYENVLTEEHETYSSEFLNTRKEAEATAVEKAFEILNYKLCQTK